MLFNRRSMNTVGSGTCPARNAEKFLVVPLHFFKCPLSGGAQWHTILLGSARLRHLMLKTGYLLLKLLHIETWFNICRI